MSKNKRLIKIIHSKLHQTSIESPKQFSVIPSKHSCMCCSRKGLICPSFWLWMNHLAKFFQQTNLSVCLWQSHTTLGWLLLTVPSLRLTEPFSLLRWATCEASCSVVLFTSTSPNGGDSEGSYTLPSGLAPRCGASGWMTNPAGSTLTRITSA